MNRREVLTHRALAVFLTVLPFGIFTLTYWLGGWTTYGEAPLPLLVFVVGSLLSLLLGASLALFLFFLTAVAQGSSLGIESSWGGFGGGLGGWRISRALAFLLGALFFAGAFATVAIQVGQHNAFRKWVGVPLVTEQAAADDPAKKGKSEGSENEEAGDGPTATPAGFNDEDEAGAGESPCPLRFTKEQSLGAVGPSLP